jgi:hypothetical protein
MTWIPGARILAGQALRYVARTASAILSSPRVITGRDAKDEYLSRWYIKGKKPAVNAQGNPVGEHRPAEKIEIYLHKFHRSDNDGALHNHPWQWAVSLVLAGGYSEERRVNKTVSLGGEFGVVQHAVERRNVFPLSVNVIRHDTFHRVDLFEPDAWSLFVVGPRVSSWSFWDRNTNKETLWREFLEQAATK